MVGICATRAIKHAKYLQKAAPHIIPQEEPPEGFGSIIPLKLLSRLGQVSESELKGYPKLAGFLKTNKLAASGNSVNGPLFQGTLFFAQVAFNTPAGAISVSNADMAVLIEYAQTAARAISGYCGQYGSNSINVSSTVIPFSVTLPGNQYNDQALQGWVNSIASQFNLGSSACVVVPNPQNVVNTTAPVSGGIGGYHSQTNNIPYCFINMFGQGVTVQDTAFAYAQQLSHEIAEMTADPNGINPEVCDACGPNCPPLYLSFFRNAAVPVYLGTFQRNVPPPPYDFFINAIAQPAAAVLCPAPASACVYAPPALLCGNSNLIEGSFRADASKPGNFEALILQGNNIMHYWRNTSDSALPWWPGVIVSSAATGPASLIESSYRADANDPGNFEALILEGNNIVHYWRDNSNSALPWNRGAIVSSMATGPACFIEGSFRADANNPGNFEALILEGNNIVHYWRDNSNSALPWNRGPVVSSAATGPACLIESSFRADSSKPGNFEALILEGNNIVHYWRDNSDPALPWNRGAVVSSAATGPACMTEGSFRADSSKPGNFETLILEGNNIVHYWRDNSDPALPWNRGVVVSSVATGAACFIEGSSRADGSKPGNFEALVPEGDLRHYWRDNSDPSLPWNPGVVI